MNRGCIAMMVVGVLAACERAPDRGGVAPTGWVVSGPGAAGFRATVDRGAGKLVAVGAGAGAGTLMQSIAADAYRGTRVRFSARVRTESVTGWTGLWMRVDRPGGRAGFDNMQDRPLAGTRGWARHTVVLDVPADAAAIRFGLLQDGAGASWIDDAALDIVGADVAVTALDAHPRALANPGFEAGTEGWLVSELEDAGDVAADRAEHHGGAASLRIRSRAGGGRGRTMAVQTIRADAYRGMRVRASLWLKADAVADGGVLAQVQAADSGIGGEGISRGSCDADGTFAWRRCEIVVDVPARADTIELAPYVGERGTLWADDAAIAQVAADTPLTWVDTRLDGPVNGDFELDVTDAPGRDVDAHGGDVDARRGGTADPREGAPMGWFVSGGARQHFEAAIDRTEHHGGRASARLAPRREPVVGYATLMQLFRAEAYRGARLRATAWVKGRGIEQRADLWVRVQAEDSPADGAGLGGGACELAGTFAWRRCEVVFDVPAAGDAIQVGLGLGGRGTLWLDDVRFERVGGDVPVSRPARAAGLTNGDFEAGATTGWFVAGGARDELDATIDRAEHATGTASARLAPRIGAPSGYGTLMQSIDAAPFRGHRLRLVAQVKGRAVAGRGDLWLRVQAAYSPADGPGLGGGACRLAGTFEWRPCEIVFDVPAEADTIQLGIGLGDRGTLWLDGVELADAPPGARVAAPIRARTRPINLDFETR